MAEIIFKKLSKRISDKNTHLFISSLTYHSIISLIPTLLLTMLILDFFNLEIGLDLDILFNYIGKNFWTNFIIAIFAIYLVSRTFFVLFKERFTLTKSLVFSLLGSLCIIVFLSFFLISYLIPNFYIENAIKLALLFGLFFLINITISDANFRYSFLFSWCFSIISLLLFYFFFYTANFFMNYENYYGILAPVFLVILAIHLFIYIVYFSYIGAEEFTKISNIKPQK